MRTFDNLSGRIVDHAELDRIFQRMRHRHHETFPDAAPTSRVMDEPVGETCQCPRCGYPLLLIAEHAFAELYECKQCGYTKQVKQ